MNNIDTLGYLKILRKHRKFLIINSSALLCLAILLSLIWPKKYKAETRFIPSFNVSTPFSELHSMETPTLALLLEGEMQYTSDILVAIMKSRTVMEYVIETTNLKKTFNRKTLEEAIDVLEKNSSIEIGDEQIVTLIVYMPSPELAAEVANLWVSTLDSFNQKAVQDQGYHEVLFIANRLESLQIELNQIIDSLARFEAKYRIFTDSDEISSTIEIYGSIVKTLIEKEIHLTKLQKIGLQNPTITMLEQDVMSLKKKLHDFEQNRYAGIVTNVPLLDLPWLQNTHRILNLKKTILMSLYGYLLMEHNIALLKSHDTTPTVVIIDYAIPPEKRAWPSRTKIVVLSLLIIVILNLSLVLAIEKVKLQWKI